MVSIEHIKDAVDKFEENAAWQAKYGFNGYDRTKAIKALVDLIEEYGDDFYIDGLDDGKLNGYNLGYDTGYDNGYEAGYEHGADVDRD